MGRSRSEDPGTTCLVGVLSDYTKLARTFGTATRLEIGFWDMGLSPPG